MSISHRFTATIKIPWTSFGSMMAEGFFVRIRSRKSAYSCFHLLSALYLCCLIATTTCVFDLPTTLPQLLITTLSTLPTDFLRSTSGTRGQTQIRYLRASLSVDRRRTRKFSRLRASSIVLGSRVWFFPIILAAFSASFAKAAPGAWMSLVFVVLSGHSIPPWLMARSQEIRDLDHKFFERGRGNVCSVEESITIYDDRFHS
jgi:hypothetical protein